MTWRIDHGDCLSLMAAMPEGSVDAVVTSPPYADQRNYQEAASAGGRTVPSSRNLSRAQRRDAPALYVEWLEPRLAAMQQVLSPDGSLMLNLGVILRDGEEHPYADDVLAMARAAGWKLLHRMVWHKPNSIPLSHPSYLHVKHEWVFWLARSTDAYRGYDEDTRTPHAPSSVRRVGRAYRDRSDERYVRRGKSYGLHDAGAKPATMFVADYDDEDKAIYERAVDAVLYAAVGGESVEHPAIMALKLALQLVSLACPPEGLVLDPFTGAGTTGVAALRRGRSFIGHEREGPYVELARQRLIDDAPLLNAMAEAAG